MSIDAVKNAARIVWPNATKVDVYQGSVGLASLNQPSTHPFRVVAYSDTDAEVGKIAGDSVEDLYQQLAAMATSPK